MLLTAALAALWCQEMDALVPRLRLEASSKRPTMVLVFFAACFEKRRDDEVEVNVANIEIRAL